MLPKKIKIGLFLDGRPGHEKQSRGIINSLGDIIDAEILEFQVPRLNLVNYVFEISKLKIFKKSNKFKFDCSECDLLLGAGRHTHLPMLFAKKMFGVKIVTCMDPGFLIRRDFDLCFIPNHDKVSKAKNIAFTTGPPNTSINNHQHKSNKGLILVGGTDEKSHYWNNEELVSQINSIIENKQISWKISSSPRTPKDTVSLLKNIAFKSTNTDFYNYLDTANDWLESQYDQNKYVWVTGDSISMVYESLTAGCDVGLIPVSWKRKNSKFHRSENYLLENNFVNLLGDDRGQTLTQPVLNESQRCAAIMMEQLWTKN
ncbi:MAG: mitochondrial fission ELM1 family protein [Desulfotalea sp.]